VDTFDDRLGPIDIDASGAAVSYAIAGGDAANGIERRRGHRIRTVFRIAKVIRDRAIGLWRVRNISDFGMMLLTHSRLAPGERLTVALSSQVAIDAHVVWSNDEACGVTFEKPIDSAATLTALVLEQREARHRPPRVETRIRACLYGEDGVQPIVVTDVSQNGVGFSHEVSVRAGLRALMVLESGLERRGIVRWSEDRRAGLELLDPFSCEELETILAA
jgi:hypothetical protein